MDEQHVHMMTSSNGNIFRVTALLCGEFTGPDEFPTQRPVTRSFDVFFDLRLNKRLNKQSWVWWFETLSRPFWRHRNEKCSVSRLNYFFQFLVDYVCRKGNAVHFRCLCESVMKLWLCHDLEPRFALLTLWGERMVTDGFPSQKVSYTEPLCVCWC